MKSYDLVIIGGGINGCGVARDAAQRGLSVLLIEKSDLGSGTSGGSSKLIHGGLRYLPQGRIGLVRQALRERSFLLNHAPHLVQTLPFLYPVSGFIEKTKVRIGLGLYDLLSLGGTTEKHQYLNREKVSSLEPALSTESWSGAFKYYDASTDDARLCLDNALDAVHHGAHVQTWTEVLKVSQDSTGVTIQTRDRLTLKEEVIRGRSAFAGLGPFFSTAPEGLRLPEGTVIAPSRGSHLVLQGSLVNHAVVMSSAEDSRIIFLIPWGDYTILGTTDVSHPNGADNVHVTSDEAQYLVGMARRFLRPAIDIEASIISSFSAVRPLIADKGSRLQDISREHRVLRQGRIIFMAGGKLTTFRAVAEECTDLVYDILDRPTIPCTTHSRSLIRGSQGAPPRVISVNPRSESLFGKDQALALARTYGSGIRELMQFAAEDSNLLTPLWDGPRPRTGAKVLACEAAFSAKYEFTRRLQDFMIRRTGLAFTQGGTEATAHKAAEIMGKVLSWPPGRIREEIDDYLEIREKTISIPKL